MKPVKNNKYLTFVRDSQIIMNFRAGFGIDFHRLARGRKLRLGGVTIPHTKCAVAHSDGDVLIHALCDALLGAAGLRDIGYYFPDSSNEFKGIDSRILLSRVVQRLKKGHYKVVNIDATVCLQRPKIVPYVDAMKHELSVILQIRTDRISIKATTTERMGLIGKEQGIAAMAVVLVNWK